MTTNCAATCNRCATPLVCPEETNTGCPNWKDQGYCEIGHQYGDWMAKNCPRTCGVCDVATGTKRSTMVTETASQTTSTYESFVSDCGHDLNGFAGSDNTCDKVLKADAIQAAEQRILDFLVAQASGGGRDVSIRSLGVDAAPPGA